MVKLVHWRVPFTADRVPEVPEPASKRTSHLGQPLRAEHEQHDREQ
jgi:hypothetical protein